MTDLGISDKHLESFSLREPDRFAEIAELVYTFEDENLSPLNAASRVYWDFERCAHILLRHYEGFFIEESTYRGDKFLYSKRDVKLLAEKVIQDLGPNIQVALSEGRDFYRRGSEAYYYQGDYYQITIDKNGKLMQFHPVSVPLKA